MGFSDENSMVMPVAPAYSNNGGWGGFGGDWGSLIVLFLIAAMFGGFGGGFGFGGMNGGLGIDFPWLLNANNQTDGLITAGFNQAATASALSGIQTGITSGFGDVQNALCAGFAGVNATVNGAQGAITQQLYTNQIADLERSYASQTANTQGIMNLQSQLAQCCCDNRLATANLSALVQSENCADRQALSDGIRDLIANQTAGTQRILDQMCQDKIDAKNDTIAQLRSELLYARGQASQDVQTAAIQAGQRALANEVEQYIAPKAMPAYIVQNPNCCSYAYTGCGCGA